MSSLLYAIVSVIGVSVLSLVGVFAISFKEATLDKILFVLLSFSAGAILGTAYLDLLPEAVEFFGVDQLSVVAGYLIVGFVAFFFLERFIYWYHGHVHGYASPVESKMTVKRFVHLNLIGDGIHNLLDGMIIAAGFLVNTSVGLTTTVAVIFHETPQEIGDFGVLVYGGFTRSKALLFNFLSALSALAGVVLATYFSAHVEGSVGFLIAVAAGGFFYLAASELIPGMQKETNVGKSMVQFGLFVLGIVLIWLLGLFFPA